MDSATEIPDRVAAGRSYGNKIAEILGIPHCRDIDLSFPMDGAATAKVTFLLNNIQAEAIVELLDDTQWGNRSTE